MKSLHSKSFRKLQAAIRKGERERKFIKQIIKTIKEIK